MIDSCKLAFANDRVWLNRQPTEALLLKRESERFQRHRYKFSIDRL